MRNSYVLKKQPDTHETGDGTPITVRLLDHDIAALDAYISAQPEPKPSRPEAARRVLAYSLQVRALSSPCPVRASIARRYAAATADVEMRAVDAPFEEKARRRKALTEEPSVVAEARGKQVK